MPVSVNSERKPYFDWENSDKSEFPAPTAKVFVAETINQEGSTEDQEKVRKLSTAAGEFRTIENEENEVLESCNINIIPGRSTRTLGSHEKYSVRGFIEIYISENESQMISKEAPKVISSEGSSNSSSTSLSQLQYSSGDKQNNNKRKRRKKSFMKKKNSVSSRENTVDVQAISSTHQQDIPTLCAVIPDEVASNIH